jgi:hypothetical protein
MSNETAEAPATRWATPYHQTVDDLRRELVGEAATFREQMKPHQKVVYGLRDAKRAGETVREPAAEERDAYIGCLMAGTFAYTLAAVLGAAGEAFGQGVCERLACVADEILTNGDDRDRNADVLPAEGDVHKCSFPLQPREGTFWAPGPCRICGKTWDRAQAEQALAEAQAAMTATEKAGA